MFLAGRAVALCFVLGIALQAHATCTLQAVAVLRLKVVDGHPVFAADVNGRQANLVLDTGSTATSLGIMSASKLGVTLNLLESESVGIGGSEHAYKGVIGHMRVASMNLDGLVVGGTQAAGASGFDGLFGMDALADYDLDLDLVGRHAIVYEAGGGCATPTVSMGQPLYQVPLDYSKGNLQAEVDVSIEDRRFRALIDSGAPTTFMFRRAASRLGLDVSVLKSANTHSSRGVGAFPVRSFTHVFRTVALGRLVLHDFPMEVIDQPGFGVDRVHVGSLLPDESRGEAGGEDLVLGADMMQAVHMWISHSSQSLILQYPPRPSVLPH